MVAVMMTVLLAMGAAAIDIGHALVARNELQNVSDAAALAGTRALGIIYEGMTTAQQQAYTLTGGDQATVVAAVQATAVANSAAGVAITVAASDIADWDLESCDQNAHSHGQPTESRYECCRGAMPRRTDDQHVPCECDRDVERQRECCGDGRHDGCRSNGTRPAGRAFRDFRVTISPSSAAETILSSIRMTGRRKPAPPGIRSINPHPTPIA